VRSFLHKSNFSDYFKIWWVVSGRRPFAEGFSPTVATVEPFFSFPSAHRVKSAIADAMVGESPSAKHCLPCDYLTIQIKIPLKYYVYFNFIFVHFMLIMDNETQNSVAITDTRLRTNCCTLSSSRILNNAPLFFCGKHGIHRNSNSMSSMFKNKGATVGIQARVEHCHTILCSLHSLYKNGKIK
jgi:hypothetical protein